MRIHSIFDHAGLHKWICANTLLLIVLCIAWEGILAPLRPGGSWLIAKALLLIWPLPALFRKNIHTMQWLSLLIWLFFAEGVVRALSDVSRLSAWLAGTEALLSFSLFALLMIYLAPIKHSAKQMKQARERAPHV